MVALATCIAIITTMKQPKLIPVGKNNFAIVDADQFDFLSKMQWHISNYCYASTPTEGGRIYMHRMVMRATEDCVVDHINHCGLDNRKSNLRLCSQKQNVGNSRKIFTAKPDRVTSSRYKGVSFRSDRMRWTAYIGTGRDRDLLGCYSTEREAAEAYNRAAIARWGPFAKLNQFEEDHLIV